MHEMKIGELARRAGLTVRTLHHYDAIGLFGPSRRSSAGYRLYGEDDLARLLEILLLRRLGLSLDEIRQTLERGEGRIEENLRLHIERTKSRLREERRLLRQLEAVADRLERTGSLSVEDLTFTMETLTMHEKYFTPEQLQTLAERKEEIGAEAISRAEAEWPELIARARAALDRGDAPETDEVQAIARRWRELTQAFTGGDPAMARSVASQYEQEPELRQKTGLDSAIFEYMGKAMALLDKAPS